jgi:hypothetical protein
MRYRENSMSKSLTLCLLLLLPMQVRSADVFETGGDLLKFCKQAADPVKRDPFTFGMCMGYIDGYISGYRFKKEVKDSPPICDDIEKRSRREVLKSVLDHLEAHPESQQELKSIAMYRAMLDKMTCQSRE